MIIYDIDKIEDLFEDFEKCRKDFKNKEYDEATSVIKNYISTVETTTTKRYSTIPMIDAILEYYAVICEEKNNPLEI